MPDHDDIPDACALPLSQFACRIGLCERWANTIQCDCDDLTCRRTVEVRTAGSGDERRHSLVVRDGEAELAITLEDDALHVLVNVARAALG